ncbi:DoxX family protein [Erwinia tracheiphila]|uniref:DoxX n=1 Tax=Erwinia tracheiphila TaxID=65700 RepID=A0A0M2KCB5_9GAMM|nr:DoxX family protein [Erwinia tracheiphila]AXF75921.1 DoxX family protein [Erwinia tracheiphila]EOS96939.1 hypothetical protein ETR_00095 [Erwinia tracheiphila PSU-1]KKF34636.1 DoxX [Erwinia tracheiphila]UIA85418.1 DoxX family protein [Erwinia tracheiphila]UIA86311.1 DoxX family protein [Erwinia tracheiphila]
MFSAINSSFTRLFDRPDFGKLLLRLTLGGLLLFHGEFKVIHGTDWITALLKAHSIPGFVAWGAYIGEVIAPVMLIIGLMTRPAAFVIAINLAFAILLVKTGAAWDRNSVGAWALESEAFYFFCAFAIMLLGPGKYVLVRNSSLH